MILAYRIKKRREKLQEFELQKIQEASQGNAMAVQVAEQEKRVTLQTQLEVDIARINAEKQWDYIIQMGKKDKDIQEAEIQKEAKVIAQRIQADARIVVSEKKQIQTPKIEK
jgi:hypothetical protein